MHSAIFNPRKRRNDSSPLIVAPSEAAAWMRYVCPGDQTASRLAEFGYSGRDFAAMSSSGAQDKRLKYQDYRFSVAPMMDWTDSPEK